VSHIFRLLDSSPSSPGWLLIENVSFMLQLDSGRAMRYLVDELERRRFAWAYRVVDSRAFGLPQRRQRVILLASRDGDPRPLLLGEDSQPEERPFSTEYHCGFYWTEGTRGLGWAVDAVPTLKGGSGLGIPSPPAIWNPRTGEIATPEIRDAERLQGFEADWTLPSVEVEGVRSGHRWKLVGNAVSVSVARWIGERLTRETTVKPIPAKLLPRGVSWPRSAWGYAGKVYSPSASMWPVTNQRPHLSEFLRFPMNPLSARASNGFLRRAQNSSLAFQRGFLDAVSRHAARMDRLN
jgi:DNA (cytosine-5)-methyltransferase 1